MCVACNRTTAVASQQACMATAAGWPPSSLRCLPSPRLRPLSWRPLNRCRSYWRTGPARALPRAGSDFAARPAAYEGPRPPLKTAFALSRPGIEVNHRGHFSPCAMAREAFHPVAWLAVLVHASDSCGTASTRNISQRSAAGFLSAPVAARGSVTARRVRGLGRRGGFPAQPGAAPLASLRLA